MNFIEAIRSGFNNYFNFKGRASKSAFWYFLLFELIFPNYLVSFQNADSYILQLKIVIFI